MNRKGAVGIAVLWILLATSTLATSVCAIARTQQRSAQLRLDETRAIYLIVSAALLDRANNFASADQLYSFSTGSVRVQHFSADNPHELRLLCHAESGRLKKEVEIGWKKSGESWRADYWSEIS